MTTNLDLTTPAGLATYLSSTPYASTSVETVSGGNVGFLYRVVLKKPLEATGERTVIVKHSLGYAAKAGPGGIILKVERMDFEHEALELVSSNPALSTVVGVPHIHAYDPTTHTLVMSDVAPCQLLSTALQESDDELVTQIGHALGDFMGKFHRWTSLPEQSGARERFLENETSKEDVLGLRWKLALAGAKKFGLEQEWMEDMYKAGMEDAKSGGSVICMADFWFGDLRIYIIDWEMARTARPEFDVAHFATAAYSLVHVHRPLPLMRAFLKAYRSRVDLDEIQLATYAGRDMMSFGIGMPWTRHRDDSIKRPIAGLGLELLEAARNGDKQALRENPVLAALYAP